ncbi:MAG TPA: AMP-binding protein, partial [Nitrosomonas europaea]|nr:AMP-binding protein [Nitrosomonas europaea]
METLQELGTSLAGWGDKHFLLKFEKQGRRTYTYGQLAQAARQLAQGLIKSGIRPGDPVGVFSLPDYESVVACLGILQAGASVMPLDLQMETQVLAAVLHDSGARAVFSSREHLSRLQEAGPTQMPIFLLDSAEGSQSWKQLFCENEAVDFPSILPETRAALFYTSGTTGMPKGVPLTHRNLAFQITTLFAAGFIQEHDRVLLPLPLHHVYPFVIGMLFPLAMGLTLVMPASLTGPKLIEAMSAGAVSIVIGVPRLYEALYAGIAAQFESGALQRAFFNKLISFLVFLARRSRLPFGRVLLSSLHRRFGSRVRILASGGALLDSGLAWNLTALGWKVAIGYGLTETAPLLTLKRPDDPHLESVGRPIPGCELRIRHAEDSRYTDVSERTKEDEAVALGEVQAKGPNVFSGYLNLPEVTREVFTEDGWFRTGDLGFFDRQGYLHLRGRVSTMIV